MATKYICDICGIQIPTKKDVHRLDLTLCYDYTHMDMPKSRGRVEIETCEACGVSKFEGIKKLIK